MVTTGAPQTGRRETSSSATRAISLIVRRELTSRLRSKAFSIGLATTVLIIFAIFGLGRLVGGEDDPIRVGLVGRQPAAATTNLGTLADLRGTEVELVDQLERSEAEAQLLDGDLDAVVADGTELLLVEEDNTIMSLIVPAWQQAALVDRLVDRGLTLDDVGSALGDSSALTLVELDPDPESDARNTVAFASVILTFIAIQMAGAYIMMGVFEEKSSKVVELVLASVKPRHLLVGKIIGVGIVGLIQVVVLAGSAIGAATLFGSDVLPAISVGSVALSVVWFLVGYLLYGSVFAAGASLAPRQEDAQSTLAPVSILLMIGYFGALFSAGNPDSLAARLISWFPATAPFAMPGRVSDGNAAWWEVVGSLGLALVTIVGVIAAAERIYVRSVIHTDRTLGWREAWKQEPVSAPRESVTGGV